MLNSSSRNKSSNNYVLYKWRHNLRPGVSLFHDLTVLQFHCLTDSHVSLSLGLTASASRSYCRSITLPPFLAVPLSHNYTVPLPFRLTVSLSHCHITPLPPCSTDSVLRFRWQGQTKDRRWKSLDYYYCAPAQQTRRRQCRLPFEFNFKSHNEMRKRCRVQSGT